VVGFFFVLWWGESALYFFSFGEEEGPAHNLSDYLKDLGRREKIHLNQLFVRRKKSIQFSFADRCRGRGRRNAHLYQLPSEGKRGHEGHMSLVPKVTT